MSQVGVWSSTLSASQISAIAALDVGADWTTSYSSGLVDYWTFGNKITEGTDTGSTIYSQVASGNDLTGVSMAAPFAGHTVTVAGDTHHSATRSVFGGSAIYFDGTGDNLSIADSPDHDLSTLSTVECWVNSLDWGSLKGIISKGGAGSVTDYNGWNIWYSASQLKVRVRTGGSSSDMATGKVLDLNQIL
jgi:hypothetical protein